jgi:hypothetical protein
MQGKCKLANTLRTIDNFQTQGLSYTTMFVVSVALQSAPAMRLAHTVTMKIVASSSDDYQTPEHNMCSLRDNTSNDTLHMSKPHSAFVIAIAFLYELPYVLKTKSM